MIYGRKHNNSIWDWPTFSNVIMHNTNTILSEFDGVKPWSKTPIEQNTVFCYGNFQTIERNLFKLFMDFEVFIVFLGFFGLY